jgi:hypothetical protein
VTNSALRLHAFIIAGDRDRSSLAIATGVDRDGAQVPRGSGSARPAYAGPVRAGSDSGWVYASDEWRDHVEV